MIPSSLTHLLREKANELGFDLVGAIPVSRSKTIDVYNSWLNKGYAGSMGYLERHAELKEDPRRLLPETMSLFALGFNYNTVDPSSQTQNPEIGCISRYAWGDDYHQLIRSKLSKLENYLCHELNAGMLSRSFVDSGPVLEREIAQRAGLGWIGKHSNLINWEKGSWFFLAELLVDVPLEANLPFTRVDCGTCTICIEACPTEAIIADRTVDARRCISYLTIELKEAIPLELRPKMGNLIFGCDICQEVCPWNDSERPEVCPRVELVPEQLAHRVRLLSLHDRVEPVVECERLLHQAVAHTGAQRQHGDKRGKIPLVDPHQWSALIGSVRFHRQSALGSTPRVHLRTDA